MKHWENPTNRENITYCWPLERFDHKTCWNTSPFVQKLSGIIRFCYSHCKIREKQFYKMIDFFQISILWCRGARITSQLWERSRITSTLSPKTSSGEPIQTKKNIRLFHNRLKFPENEVLEASGGGPNGFILGGGTGKEISDQILNSGSPLHGFMGAISLRNYWELKFNLLPIGNSLKPTKF